MLMRPADLERRTRGSRPSLHPIDGNDDGAIGPTVDSNDVLLIGLMTSDASVHDRTPSIAAERLNGNRYSQQRSRHAKAMPLLVLNWL
jgi:hypothetical protein